MVKLRTQNLAQVSSFYFFFPQQGKDRFPCEPYKSLRSLELNVLPSVLLVSVGCRCLVILFVSLTRLKEDKANFINLKMRVRDIKIFKKATNLTKTNKTKTRQRQTIVLVFVSN